MINPGHFSTIQDLGRHGMRHRGVPLGGAFDRKSFALANALLGNSQSSACLEMTLIGGQYEALEPLGVALAGAPMSVTIQRNDGRSDKIDLPRSFPLSKGDRLDLGGTAVGVRSYLAVVGGFLTPLVLGARSIEKTIRAGDVLPTQPSTTSKRATTVQTDPKWGEPALRILVGPDAIRLPDSIDQLITKTWLMDPRSNRVGVRLKGILDGIPIEPNRRSIPVWPGAIEFTGSELIILGPACGTMGGYPVVAHLTSADLDALAWLRPGETVRFDLVTLEERTRSTGNARSSGARLSMRSRTWLDQGIRNSRFGQSRQSLAFDP